MKRLDLKLMDSIRHRIEVFHKLLENRQEIYIVMDFERIFSYAQHHKVDFFGQEIKLNKADQVKYCKHIAKLLETYDNIHLYPLTNVRALDGIKTYSTDIMLTDEDFLVRKHISTLKPLDDRYGQILDESICQQIYRVVEADFHELKLKHLDPDVFLDFCLMHIH